MLAKEKAQNKLLYFAHRHLGKPYQYGARLYQAPRVFDCSSFIQYLYQRIKINLPRTALEQAHFGRVINLKKEKLKIGDLIFLHGQWGHYNPEFPQGIGHVMMYVGNDQIIHAKSRHNKKGINVGRVKKDSFKKIVSTNKITVIKRII